MRRAMYVVLQCSPDGCIIVLITLSLDKANEVADILQKTDNPDCTADLYYEVESYFGFKGLDNWLDKEK